MARGTMQFKISDFTSQTHGIEVLDDVAAEHGVGIGEDHAVAEVFEEVAGEGEFVVLGGGLAGRAEAFLRRRDRRWPGAAPNSQKKSYGVI
jgi:hypothetical protein